MEEISRKIFRSTYKSKDLYELRKSKALPVFLIFMFSAIITSVPALVVLFTRPYSSMTAGTPKIDLVISELVEQEVDCVISANDATLNCGTFTDFESNGYKVTYTTADTSIAGLKDSTIFLTPHKFVAIHFEDGDYATFEGTYTTLLADFDFTKINQSILSNTTTSEEASARRLTSAKNMIIGLFKSSIPHKSFSILFVNLTNFFVSVFAGTFLMLIINFKAPTKVLGIKESFKMVVFATFIAAFAAAMVSLYSGTVASIVFPTVLAIKLVFGYVYIMKKRKALGIV